MWVWHTRDMYLVEEKEAYCLSAAANVAANIRTCASLVLTYSLGIKT